MCRSRVRGWKGDGRVCGTYTTFHNILTSNHYKQPSTRPPPLCTWQGVGRFLSFMIHDYDYDYDSYHHSMKYVLFGSYLSLSPILSFVHSTSTSSCGSCRVSCARLRGESGWQAIQKFFCVIQGSDDSMDHLRAVKVFKLELADCFDRLIIGMCDTYRRLVLLFQTFPYKAFPIVSLSVPDALEKCKAFSAEGQMCKLCADEPFTKAS